MSVMSLELEYRADEGGWLVRNVTRDVGSIIIGPGVPLSDFLLAESTPEYPAAAATPLEAAQQLLAQPTLVERVVERQQVKRLAASTLSRDIENFLDGLGHVLHPTEIEELTEYLESRG